MRLDSPDAIFEGRHAADADDGLFEAIEPLVRAPLLGDDGIDSARQGIQSSCETVQASRERLARVVLRIEHLLEQIDDDRVRKSLL